MEAKRLELERLRDQLNTALAGETRDATPEERRKFMREYAGAIAVVGDFVIFRRKDVQGRKPVQPEWLSQALNEGDGTYRP